MAAAWGLGGGFFCGLGEVTEFSPVEARACAAASVALVMFGCFGYVLHGPSPRGTFWCKVFEREEMSPDLVLVSSLLAVKCDGPAFGRAFFLSTSILSK